MLRGIALLFQRTLLVDQRRAGPWLLRTCVVLIGFFSLMAYSSSTARNAAPGLGLMRFTFLLNLLAVTGFASGYFPSILAEETEEGNFDLLVISGLHPISLVLGKLMARLCSSLLLLAVQAPFLVVAVTLGGVLRGHVLQAIFFIFAYTLALAGLGLFCSVGADSTPQAVRRTLPWIGLPWLGLPILSALGGVAPILYQVHALNKEIHPFLILKDLLSPGSVPSHFTAYSLGFAAGGLLLGVGAILRLQLRIHLRLTAQSTDFRGPRSRPSLRVSGDPVKWLTLHVRLGRVRALLASWGIMLILCVTGQWVLACFFVLTAGALSAVQLLGPDARDGNLETLIMLPLEPDHLLRGKLKAWWVHMLPLFAGLTLLNLTEVHLGAGRLVFLLFFVVESLIFFLFCIHFSLRMRWGAIPVAAALTGIGINLAMMLIGAPMMAAGVIAGSIWIGLLLFGCLLGQYRRLGAVLERSIGEIPPL